MAEKDHHHSSHPPGWADLVLGAIAFVLVSEGVFVLVGLVKPGLFLRDALFEMQLSGGLFFLVWALVGRLTFEPFLESAIAREQATVGAVAEVQRLASHVQQLEQDLDESLRESRLAGIQARDKQIEEAKHKAASVLDDAKQEAAKELERANGELLSLRAKAESELAAKSGELKQLVVEQVLNQNRAIH